MRNLFEVISLSICALYVLLAIIYSLRSSVNDYSRPSISFVYSIFTAFFVIIGVNLLVVQFDRATIDFFSFVEPGIKVGKLKLARAVSLLVAAAFLANCGRAAFMLARLDQGELDEHRQWHRDLSGPISVAEFSLRAAAGACFIVLLDKISGFQARGESWGSLEIFGKLGVLLYVILLVWAVIPAWHLGYSLAHRFRTAHFACGIAVSCYVWAMGWLGSFKPEDGGTYLLMGALLAGIAALAMLLNMIVAFSVYVFRRTRALLGFQPASRYQGDG